MLVVFNKSLSNYLTWFEEKHEIITLNCHVLC